MLKNNKYLRNTQNCNQNDFNITQGVTNKNDWLKRKRELNLSEVKFHYKKICDT